MQPEEDSDEEWVRIADDAVKIAAQHVANRNTQSVTTAITATTPSRPPPATKRTLHHPSETAERPEAERPSSRPPVVRPSRACTDSDADPYALALRQRDTELAQMRTEHAGEVANYRNKVRSLQNQVLAARNTDSARDEAEGRVWQLEREKERMEREMEELRREMGRMEERMAFAEHEAKEARERERRHLTEEGGEGEIVEGTQFVGGTQFAGGTQIVGGGGGMGGSVGFKMGGRSGGVRLPVRRRRRVSSAGGRLEGRVEEKEKEKEKRAGTKRSVEEAVKEDGNGSTGGVDEMQHGWGVRLEEGQWEYGRLRREIFGSEVGRRLVELGRRMKEKGLSEGILGAMGGDGGWRRLMEEVGRLQGGGRSAQMISVECLCVMLRYCGECRRGVGRGESEILEMTRGSLERATRERDGELAAGCIRVLIGGGCGIGEVGGGCEKSRRAICCEAALEWIGGEDVRVVREGVGLVEVVSGLAMEEETDGEGEGWRGEEWGFVERGYTRACEVVRDGRGDDECVRLVMAMLTRGMTKAPYILAESGGGEVAAELFMWGVEREETEVAVGCGKVVCAALEEGGVSGGTRRVLGAMAWGGVRSRDEAMARECRRVAVALQNAD